MFKSRRRRIITIGGLLAAIVTWVAFQPNDLREHDIAGDVAIDGVNTNPAYEGSVVCERDCQVTFGIDGELLSNDRVGSGLNKQAEHEYHLSQYDLRAQERMAWWTILIAIFTAVGVFFLAETLEETALATRYASEAADLARQTLNGDRAWLLMGDVDTAANNDVDANGNHIRPDFFFNMRMSNSGRSPAINVEIRRQLKIEQRPVDPEVVSIDENVEWSATVPVGSGQQTTIHWFQVQIDALRAVRRGTHRVLMLVEVRYNDIFTNLQHSTRACCEVLVVLPEDRLLWKDVPLEIFQFPAVGINVAE